MSQRRPLNKKFWLIVLVVAAIGLGATVLFFTPLLLTHLLEDSKTERVRSPKGIENALIALKQQKFQLFAPHVAFKISRRPRVNWFWSVNLNGAKAGHSWTEGDRLIEFSKVGDDMLAYSVPIRWREDASAGEVVSETYTNVSPSMSGNETYSTSDEEYKRLTDFLKAKTSKVDLRCSIGRDSTGRVVQDIEYLDGTLSLPQGQWADFVQDLFKQVYHSEQPIYREEIKLSAFP
jgi:hypothetical protein